MEILYIWINKYNCINKKGFNFSPEYEFNIKINDEKWVFSKRETGKINIMKDGCVANLTAIVGENGVGKTTLMHYLNDLNCFPKTKNNKELYSKNMNIIVTKNKGKIILYTNIDPEKITYLDCEKIKKINMYVHNQSGKKGTEILNDFYDRTSIYETNSSYGLKLAAFHLKITIILLMFCQKKNTIFLTK